MSKGNKKKKKVNIEANNPGSITTASIDKTNTQWWKQARYHKIILFIFAFLLYANTLSHDYTQDDAIVIYDNMYTTEGISGIKGLLTKDTFFGFFKVDGKAKLVSGGRYRPLTPVMFALEWELFGRNPFVGHLINILLFGLCGLLLYSTIKSLLNKMETPWIIAFIAALIFVAHPIHTEVVANIKGRDEIVSLLASLFALYASLKYFDRKSIIWLLAGAFCFFLGLMSKENAITFLAIIPVALILFRKSSILKSVQIVIPFLIVTFVFLGIRTSILGMDFGGAPMELMNNPYIKLENNQYVPFSVSEKVATISYTLGKYIQLLVFPHPLTHDYYPRHIDIMQFSDISVILSIILYIALIFSIFYFWKRSPLISFCFFYYLATLSIVSNIVFPIGTNMSERFMFMPSVGFSLFIAFLISKFLIDKIGGKKSMLLVGVLILAFSAKTFTRNLVWKDDYTLFTTDVKTSKNSAKVLNAAGGAISTSAYGLPDGPEKKEKLETSILYLDRATSIHPNYKNAYLLKGNAHYFLKNYDKAIKEYDIALTLDPQYNEALKNLAITLRDAGRFYGEQQRDYSKAQQYLLRSFELNNTDYEVNRLLGITYGILGDHKNAIKYFEQALEINDQIPQLYASLGTAYLNYGDDETARIFFEKAHQMDPNILNRLGKK